MNLFLAVFLSLVVAELFVYIAGVTLRAWVFNKGHRPLWMAEHAARIAAGQAEVAKECADWIRQREHSAGAIPWLHEAVQGYLESLTRKRMEALGEDKWRQSVMVQLQLLGTLVGKEIAIDFASANLAGGGDEPGMCLACARKMAIEAGGDESAQP